VYCPKCGRLVGECSSKSHIDKKYKCRNCNKMVVYHTEPERLLYYKRLAMMKGNDVKWVQYELVRKGFMPSVNAKGKTNIDGYFGKTTSDAVKAFQKSIGINFCSYFLFSFKWLISFIILHEVFNPCCIYPMVCHGISQNINDIFVCNFFYIRIKYNSSSLHFYHLHKCHSTTLISFWGFLNLTFSGLCMVNNHLIAIPALIFLVDM
jgi:hypothetical protein